MTESEILEQIRLDLTDVLAALETVSEQIELSNQIHAGMICFVGVLVGVVLMSVFWNRLR